MNSEIISAYLAGRIAAGDFPSAVYRVAQGGETIFSDAIGLSVVAPEKIFASSETIYDLASLTKPVITGLICAKLFESGKLWPDEKIGRFFAEAPSFTRDIDLQALLTHTSGLPAWRPFYLLANAPERRASKDSGASSTSADESKTFVLNNIIRSPSEYSPKTKVVYSDLNFLLLGFLIEKVFGEDFRAAATAEIIEPLGLTSTFLGDTGKLRYETAASENGNEYERQMCAELGYLVGRQQSADVPAMPKNKIVFRDYQIWGEVHDGNAWYLGGAAGHAGAFASAGELLELAKQFLPRHTRLLRPETCAAFRTNFTNGLNEDRSHAFQLASTRDSAAGAALPEQSFGHSGFTGTSLWIDPINDRIFILLTNRTHARRLPFANINEVRRRFHALAAGELDKI